MVICSTLFLLGLLGLVSISGFNAILYCFIVGLSSAIMGACIWSGVVVVTTPSTVGVAMGLSSAFQTFGAGLFLLIGGFILDAGTDTKSKWLNFFVMGTCAVGVSLIAALAAWYLDSKIPHRPLRSRSSVKPSLVSAEDTMARRDSERDPFIPSISSYSCEPEPTLPLIL